MEDSNTQYTPSSPLLTSGHIAFRLARRTDVQGIQNCNLATLPENYNSNFYVNHMRTWPELTLVAEHIPEGFELGEEEDPSTITPLSEYIGRRVIGGRSSSLSATNNRNKPRKEIVGYILGKVEERPLNPARQIFPPSRVPLMYDDEETLMQYMNGNSNGARVPPPLSVRQQQQVPKEKIGHVTSLAVHSHARRLGIASSLLHQLHYHLKECYDAESIGLHVRISNKAAVRLYIEEGYDVADIIPLYYGDGEDAYFMRKDFVSVGEQALPAAVRRQSRAEQQQGRQQRQWRRGERERSEWLNRDATRSGSFFDNRKSMRDTMTQEERAWVNSGGNSNPQMSQANLRTARSMSSSSPPPSSLSGQFKRSFRTFFNGGEQMQSQRQVNQFHLPPWEIGPEGLRLPRYSRVYRKEEEEEVIETRGSRVSLKVLVTDREEESNYDSVVDADYDDGTESYEVEEDELALDTRVASGSV